MSIKLYSFAASDYNDCMKLTVKEFKELPNEIRQTIKTIIIPTGYGQVEFNLDGFYKLEHLYLPDDFKIIHENYAERYGNKNHARKCAKTNPDFDRVSNIKFDWVNGYEIINETTEFKNKCIDKIVERFESLSDDDFDWRIIVCQLNEIEKIINEHTLNINAIKEQLNIINEIKDKQIKSIK